ncbi:MAG TPA: response regulator [Chthoniobacteraceae bacterium]|jgi:DNA-binding response OmpR family regulator|nr:response regulator [Chthoniobacteraceae bacterium]
MTCHPNHLEGAKPETLPEKPRRRAINRAKAAPKNPASRKILILEDDDAFRGFLTRLMSQHGFEVITVVNGVDGVHQVLAHDFDAILCDMMMPTLPGDMFYRAVERMRPHLCQRFIFMTGHYEQQKVKTFLANTGGTILLKPFHIDDLREMLAFVELRNLHLAN